MYLLTRVSGVLFFAAAAATGVFSFIDTAPELAAAVDALGTEPIVSSVKFSIGVEVVPDVVFIAIFAIFGWFLWSSEIQQTWAVAITAVLLIGSIVVRVTPVLPMDVARHSPGLAFWGALVIDDYYPAPLKPETEARNVITYPANQYYYMVVTEQNLSGSEPHPSKSVVLNFNKATTAANQFWGRGQAGAQIIGRLAGTRSILDYDHKRDVYSVPHLMVEEVAAVGARNSR